MKLFLSGLLKMKKDSVLQNSEKTQEAYQQELLSSLGREQFERISKMYTGKVPYWVSI